MMRCFRCEGIGIYNWFEATGENVSTDCPVCFGSGFLDENTIKLANKRDPEGWKRQPELFEGGNKCLQ